MKVIFLIHHENSLGYSMERYTKFLEEGMRKRGHNVEVWGPKLYLSNIKKPETLKKWLRYADQYLLFPFWFKKKSKTYASETLYVLIDQALGIWMSFLKHKNHVVHCHDFIALKSARGLIKENPVGWSGTLYQKLILNGFSKANNFISVSKNTQEELLSYLNKKTLVNEQIYNALDPLFKPGPILAARKSIGSLLKTDLQDGYLLHVGGNTFYKNRKGVLQLYEAWRKQSAKSLPLLMVGSPPTIELIKLRESSPYKSDIFYLVRIDDQLLLKAYQGATLFIFPSLMEGFGFPIAEAMATGCPVLTTDEAPMNEIGGTVAAYIQKYPLQGDIEEWARESAVVLEAQLSLSTYEYDIWRENSITSARRFEETQILDQVETVYENIIATSTQ